MKTVREVWLHEPPAHKHLLTCLLDLVLSIRVTPYCKSPSECICISTLWQRDCNTPVYKNESNILEETMLELALWVNPKVKRNIFIAFNKARICWLITANEKIESRSSKVIVNDRYPKGSSWTTHQKQGKKCLQQSQVWCAVYNAGAVLWFSVYQGNLYWEWSWEEYITKETI